MGWHEFFFGSGGAVLAFLGLGLPAVMGISAGLQGLAGLFGARSASRSRGQAEALQREQIQSARDFQGQAQQAYGARDPLRQAFMSRLMGFRGSPENPFAGGMFGPQPGMTNGPTGRLGAPPGIQGLAGLFGGGGGTALPPQATPGGPGAFNPHPQFGPGQNLLASQITPQIDRSALDALRGILGLSAGG